MSNILEHLKQLKNNSYTDVSIIIKIKNELFDIKNYKCFKAPYDKKNDISTQFQHHIFSGLIQGDHQQIVFCFDILKGEFSLTNEYQLNKKPKTESIYLDFFAADKNIFYHYTIEEENSTFYMKQEINRNKNTGYSAGENKDLEDIILKLRNNQNVLKEDYELLLLKDYDTKYINFLQKTVSKMTKDKKVIDKELSIKKRTLKP